MSPTRPRHVALLIGLVFIWAVSWPVIRVAVADVPPIWFGVMRYAVAAVIVFPAVFLTRGLRWPPRQDWSLVIVSGSLQMGAYAALMAYALTALPAGRASVVAYSTPLWVVPLAAVRLGERVSARQVCGVVLGLFGLLVIAAPSLQLLERQALLAYLALAAASLAWALTIVFVRGHTFKASAFELAPWQMLVATLLLLPTAIVVEGPPPALSRTAVMALAFIGPVSTAFAYWAAVEAGRRFRAGTVAMSLLATPCLGILISSLTLGERIDAMLLAGLLLVVFGILATLSVPSASKADSGQRAE